MAKRKLRASRSSGIQEMKLIAIKQECYAISGVATTTELKRKYVTLCRDRDFRKRKTWEYLLENLRAHGDWIGIRVSDIEYLAESEKECKTAKSKLGKLSFHPGRVEMDKAAENDD
jgi:hypothetical protein